jgi:hypothetical protein
MQSVHSSGTLSIGATSWGTHIANQFATTPTGNVAVEALPDAVADADAEARLLSACATTEDNRSPESVRRLWLPKGDSSLQVRLFPDGWATHQFWHRWFGPTERLVAKFWSAAEKKWCYDVFRVPYVPCLKSELDADGKLKECPLCGELKDWNKRGGYFGGWADSLRAWGKILFPVVVRAASWTADFDTQVVVFSLKVEEYQKVQAVLSACEAPEAWETGCWLLLEQQGKQFRATVEFEPAPDEYRSLACPPMPDTRLDEKAVERLEALALVLRNWQAHPSLFSSKRVKQLRTWMPGAALIPQRVGTKAALAKNYVTHGACWNHLDDEQQRDFDYMLSSTSIAVLVGRASRRLVDNQTLCLGSVDLDGNGLVAPFLDKNPWSKNAQKSSGGSGGNLWFEMRLNKDKPFPDGVIRIQGEGKQIGELRLGGGALTTISGVHVSGAVYRIENGGNLPVIDFEDIKLPEGWSLAEDPALAEMREAMELAKQLGKDAESIREERRAERRRICGGENVGGLENCLLDLDKIEHKHDKGHFIEARCPVCWQDGNMDKAGDHLFIDKMTGAFGCVVHPGDKTHRHSILKIVGKPASECHRIEQERVRHEDDELDRLYAQAQAGQESEKKQGRSKAKGRQKCQQAHPSAEYQTRRQPKPSPDKAEPPFLYDGKHHYFWRKERDGLRYVSVTSDRGCAMLTAGGLTHEAAQSVLNDIVTGHVVDIGLSLAGYRVGIHHVNGRRILVPRSFTLIEPKEPKSPEDFRHIMAIINGLLEEEASYLLAHLKLDYLALSEGRLSGSTAVFIVGPIDCGKSVLLDHIITPLLGGRKGNAYGYLSGKTNFNDELIGCEVHAIDDGNPFDTLEARKRFGNAIKEAVASGSMWCHPKGVAGFTVPAYRRLFILANPDDLELMPELSESLMDKIMILQAHTFKMPDNCLPLPAWGDVGARERFVATLKNELPYFIHCLLNWSIPADVAERRFGLVAYKNEEIMDQLKELSNLHEVAAVIRMGVFGGGGLRDSVEMETNDLYERLVESELVKDRARILFRNVRGLGNALGRLRRDKAYGPYFSYRKSDGHSWWLIKRQPGVAVPHVEED